MIRWYHTYAPSGAVRPVFVSIGPARFSAAMRQLVGGKTWSLCLLSKVKPVGVEVGQ
jgi:hypothetical protein